MLVTTIDDNDQENYDDFDQLIKKCTNLKKKLKNNNKMKLIKINYYSIIEINHENNETDINLSEN